MTKEIERSAWKAFFEQFTLRHDSWPAVVQTVEPGRHPHNELDERPFEGITLNPEQSVVIATGKHPDRHQHLTIDSPIRVRVETENDSEQMIEVESDDGTITRVKFRAGMPAGSLG